MKTSEEMIEFFRSRPSKKKENPYWRFNEEARIIVDIKTGKEFDPEADKQFLIGVRKFFRCYYDSFHSEAQVLCVKRDDALILNKMGIPILRSGNIGSFDVHAVVLPQDNSGGTSRISEAFWQNAIIGHDIQPVARIHSHHVLEPYQSSTDYSTLNSGTMEMVIGKIYQEDLSICYWLDVHGTDTKAQTFVAKETDKRFEIIPHVFNGRPNYKQEQ